MSFDERERLKKSPHSPGKTLVDNKNDKDDTEEDAHNITEEHDANQQDNNLQDVPHFFLFICVSTALRSFEAGIVSSMMPDIRADLQLDYADEGTIAASPDYGFPPGALISIFVFRYCALHHRRRSSTQTVLAVAMFGASLAAFFCSAYPSKSSLVLARSVGGFLWACVAVHYPVWIDRRGPTHSHTLWLGCTNVSLLVGILAGYVIGGAARTMAYASAAAVQEQNTTSSSLSISRVAGSITWVNLYFLEGLFMAVCSVAVLMGFDSDLVRSDYNPENVSSSPSSRQQQQRYDAVPSEEEEDPGAYTLCELLLTLLHSVPFILAVLITGGLSGGVVFALYFITQLCETRGFDQSEAVVVITAVFVTGPGPGMLFGSWIVNRMGGYENLAVTFGVTLFSAVAVLGATILFPVSWAIWGDEWQLPFAVACWIFFFAGAMSGPPLNGVAVSVVPRASHVASGLQFCLANSAKIIVPQIGGFVCNRLGLINGFNATLLVCAFIFLALSWMGLAYAKRCRGYETLP